MRHFSHLHPDEYRHIKEANKGKADQSKATQSSEPATSHQPRYEQSTKVATRKKQKTALLSSAFIHIVENDGSSQCIFHC